MAAGNARREQSPMTYLYLVLAIVFEAGWAIAMKMSDGLTRPRPAAATLVFYLLSLVFLALATRRLDVGPAYAVWAGSGAVLIALAGIFYFKEPASALKLASMALVVLGIVGLQLAEGGRAAKLKAQSGKAETRAEAARL
jgi:multidrug transporter EmrE-like cation transporter